MWIVTTVLVVVGWTGAGFVAALLFYRLGFGFEARRGAAEHMPQAPEPDVQRHRGADPSYALTPVDSSRRRRGRQMVEPHPDEHERGRPKREHRQARAAG